MGKSQEEGLRDQSHRIVLIRFQVVERVHFLSLLEFLLTCFLSLSLSLLPTPSLPLPLSPSLPSTSQGESWYRDRGRE